ncbi:hypothetical protein BS50DRAFT_567122 [Corynespora cassiicola Philippines]|uniref:Uncharacterized protein n=1 Tax=Corynespora cassiicola Philippines TaxID=1448308 RepID=A0A2T2P9F4_CORCC|nr:hypothetical protein BS50DRAFT_567122 [Corynespora cassiicola Philippines]
MNTGSLGVAASAVYFACWLIAKGLACPLVIWQVSDSVAPSRRRFSWVPVTQKDITRWLVVLSS